MTERTAPWVNALHALSFAALRSWHQVPAMVPIGPFAHLTDTIAAHARGDPAPLLA